MLKKLTTNAVNIEKKEVIERTANIDPCSFAVCRTTICGRVPDIAVELQMQVRI